MGEFYGSRGIRADDRAIETYALGLDSWTLAQESTYLASRISAYDPDVILQLSVSNDITPLAGVNGLGMATYEFSPEARQWGSGLFSNQAARFFGERNFSALAWSLSPQSRREWTRAFSALGRLVELQQRRGGKILLSVLDYPFAGEFFSELYTWHFRQSKLPAPFLATSFLPSFETQLPHDAHPNRLGNSYLAGQYIHALNRLGWIPVPDSDLPKLPEELTLDLNPEPDPERVRRDREEFVSGHLRSSLDFGRLSREETRAFLGGVFPEQGGEKALQGYPWASIRSGFLMSRLEGGSERRLVMEIRIPPLPELFPFRLTVLVEGAEIARLDLETPEPSDRYRLVGNLPGLDRREPVREIVLVASSYFAGIGNPRMKSFRWFRRSWSSRPETGSCFDATTSAAGPPAAERPPGETRPRLFEVDVVLKLDGQRGAPGKDHVFAPLEERHEPADSGADGGARRSAAAEAATHGAGSDSDDGPGHRSAGSTRQDLAFRASLSLDRALLAVKIRGVAFRGVDSGSHVTGGPVGEDHRIELQGQLRLALEPSRPFALVHVADDVAAHGNHDPIMGGDRDFDLAGKLVSGASRLGVQALLQADEDIGLSGNDGVVDALAAERNRAQESNCEKASDHANCSSAGLGGSGQLDGFSGPKPPCSSLQQMFIYLD